MDETDLKLMIPYDSNGNIDLRVLEIQLNFINEEFLDNYLLLLPTEILFYFYRYFVKKNEQYKASDYSELPPNRVKHLLVLIRSLEDTLVRYGFKIDTMRDLYG